MTTDKPQIERNVWMLWLQGFEAAPDLVKICSETWIRLNPGWKVHLLSRETLAEYLDDQFANELYSLSLPPQKTANLVRLYLITRYGGVWADADCYCTRPLDQWLPPLISEGFFAFRFPADTWLKENQDRRFTRLVGRSLDRILGNWFLAGRAGNPITSRFLESHLKLFKQGNFATRRPKRLLMRLAAPVFRRNAYMASKLSGENFLRLIGGFPYFIFHYHFARLVKEDAEFRASWHAIPVADARIPLTYSKDLHLETGPQFMDDMAGRGLAPLYKLHYRRAGAAIRGSRYRTLINSAARTEAG